MSKQNNNVVTNPDVSALHNSNLLSVPIDALSHYCSLQSIRDDAKHKLAIAGVDAEPAWHGGISAFISVAQRNMEIIRAKLAERERVHTLLVGGDFDDLETWNVYRWLTKSTLFERAEESIWIVVASADFAEKLKAECISLEGYIPELCSLIPMSRSDSLQTAIGIANKWCEYTNESGVFYDNSANTIFSSLSFFTDHHDGTAQADLSQFDLSGNPIVRQ